MFALATVVNVVVGRVAFAAGLVCALVAVWVVCYSIYTDVKAGEMILMAVMNGEWKQYTEDGWVTV